MTTALRATGAGYGPRLHCACPGGLPGFRSLTALALLLGMTACGTPGSAPGPQASPVAGSTEPEAPAEDTAVQSSTELTAFYSQVEGELTASGKMRREVAPDDAPYNVDDLARNFERIALHNEYVDYGGRFVRSETPSYLSRWNGPVRVAVMTSPSVPVEEATRDRANVVAFTNRLSRLTGLDMKTSENDDVNFLVLFMNSAERAAFAEQVSVAYPGFAPSVMDAIRDSSLELFCTAYAFGEPTNRSVYSSVLILIRAEHPPLTRLSCVQEEMAQGMGLPNDSPDARPSLFNDSLEFALLTEHDEILLTMLYDPRLRPGMSADQARPLLHDIAQDAMEKVTRSRDPAYAGTN